MVEPTVITPTLSIMSKIYTWLGYNPDPVKISKSIRSSVCGFQLKFTNYQFSSSLLHKKFKEIPVDDKTKKDAFVALNEYSASELKRIATEIVNGISAYFLINKKSSLKPRVSIYAVKKDRSLIKLASSYNEGDQDYSRKLSADYTCFSHACDTGLPYLDNDIPRKIISNEEYRHDGFDLDAIREKYGTWSRRRGIHKFCSILLRKVGKDSIDKQWAKVAPKEGRHPDSLYKSHLVLPITFRKHADDGELSSTLIDKLNLKDDGRTTLGVIVVDHPSEYYFDPRDREKNENIDVNLLYIYADILSLAFVSSFMYTAGSESWLEYKGGIK